MTENQIKLFGTVCITPVMSIFSGIGILIIPVLLLIASNIIDYTTGIVASPYRGEKVNSYKSFKGIAKKVCMWLLVCVGILLDVFITNLGHQFNITVPSVFIITCIVVAWLFFNEIISILENMCDIGVDMPSFLLPLVKNIKKQVEQKAETEVGAITKESE